ncbi:MAG: signal recognition particle protein [Candidatus Edwardsbacteria bacterium]|nr:signal recognition particle protein [Candidatus Edwardsbacteria bacterium]MBU1577319.1 signal recognition particle protein [Candidatus Edwardsbacteria bacterium]MBU2464292.1 signal recognition particle protein [Candidatus Edwardsbacteria bacterium]MBU2594920.1 signal recognition particle protein [Candidatus Edwardsbacteria bacterium]
MFDSLSEKLTGLFKDLTGKGKLSEDNIKEASQKVKRALLEADVNYKVVKDFVAAIEEKALGAEVLNSITPGQQFIKIVHEQLSTTLGTKNEPLRMASQPPTVVMVCGLQGSGKTTTCAKLAKSLLQPGRRVMLAAADVYRPAAIEQLEILSQQVGCDFFKKDTTDVVDICKSAHHEAVKRLADWLILDTAGRLHINQPMMEELKAVQAAVKPHEILLVVDGMTGQDAVNIATEFSQWLNLSGVIMTKLDGDARGGAALSLRAVTGKPIKYIGLGEKLNALEAFHPERMASRILGLGDVVGLVEKAQSVFDQKQAAKMEEKVRKQSFTLEDFSQQMKQIKKMGSMSEIMAMIPGAAAKLPQNAEIDDQALSRIEAIISSMTPQEKSRPQVINGSRRKRIALGSGTSVQEVNRLLNQFEMSQKMMKQMMNSKGRGFKMPKGF